MLVMCIYVQPLSNKIWTIKEKKNKSRSKTHGHRTAIHHPSTTLMSLLKIKMMESKPMKWIQQSTTHHRLLLHKLTFIGNSFCNLRLAIGAHWCSKLTILTLLWLTNYKGNDAATVLRAYISGTLEKDIKSYKCFLRVTRCLLRNTVPQKKTTRRTSVDFEIFGSIF
jgi:hypothetical protein